MKEWGIGSFLYLPDLNQWLTLQCRHICLTLLLCSINTCWLILVPWCCHLFYISQTVLKTLEDTSVCRELPPQFWSQALPVFKTLVHHSTITFSVEPYGSARPITGNVTWVEGQWVTCSCIPWGTGYSLYSGQLSQMVKEQWKSEHVLLGRDIRTNLVCLALLFQTSNQLKQRDGTVDRLNDQCMCGQH